MAASGTVAMLLPGAYYFLRETTLPPIATLRAAVNSLADRVRSHDEQLRRLTRKN